VQFPSQIQNLSIRRHLPLHPGDYYKLAKLASSADNSTWAVTWLEADCILEPPPSIGPRFLLRNVTVWSSRSYALAAPYIAQAMRYAEEGLVWDDSSLPFFTAPPRMHNNKAWMMPTIVGVGAGMLLLIGVHQSRGHLTVGQQFA
jgi:hypothetical protein